MVSNILQELDLNSFKFIKSRKKIKEIIWEKILFGYFKISNLMFYELFFSLFEYYWYFWSIRYSINIAIYSKKSSK